MSRAQSRVQCGQGSGATRGLLPFRFRPVPWQTALLDHSCARVPTGHHCPLCSHIGSAEGNYPGKEKSPFLCSCLSGTEELLPPALQGARRPAGGSAAPSPATLPRAQGSESASVWPETTLFAQNPRGSLDTQPALTTGC